MNDKHFDFVLVTDFFRTATFFLSVIKGLAREYSIAIYVAPAEEKILKKNQAGQRSFLQACEKLGAKVFQGQPIEAAVALIAQRPYSHQAIEAIKRDVRADRFVGALTLAWPGMHHDFLRAFKIKTVYVIDLRFMDFLLDQRDPEPYRYLKLVEVGLPFEKYPLCKNFSADYMLVIPTAFSFPHEQDKWLFLETLLILYEKMLPSDKIVFKPHNGLEQDGFSGSIYRSLAKGLDMVPFFNDICKYLAKMLLPVIIGKFFGKLYTACLYHRVLARTTSLETLSHLHHFGVELFYPFVRKGIIGGLSNTQWGALYYRLPFYNCVEIENQERGADDVIYGREKRVDKFLELNLKYFGVEYCNGQLSFDKKQFEIISEETRQGDIVSELKLRRIEMN